MLDLTRQKFKKVLQKQQKTVEDELKTVDKEDPVLSDSLAESSEPGTDSWMADVHTKTLALRQNLQGMLKSIQRSLSNLKNGNYGKCERCGNSIEVERLEAIPTATLCVSCSKKAPKK